MIRIADWELHYFALCVLGNLILGSIPILITGNKQAESHIKLLESHDFDSAKVSRHKTCMIIFEVLLIVSVILRTVTIGHLNAKNNTFVNILLWMLPFICFLIEIAARVSIVSSCEDNIRQIKLKEAENTDNAEKQKTISNTSLQESDDVLSKLEKWFNLLQTGAITQEEYDNVKNNIINSNKKPY